MVIFLIIKTPLGHSDTDLLRVERGRVKAHDQSEHSSSGCTKCRDFVDFVTVAAATDAQKCVEGGSLRVLPTGTTFTVASEVEAAGTQWRRE